MKRQSLLGLVTLIVGLSGFCGLVFLVVWDRAFKYSFGIDAISSVVIAGTLLLGVGLGAYISGKWRKDAYKSYAAIQLVIGICGILGFYLISPVAVTLAQMVKPAPQEVAGWHAVGVVGSILLLLPFSALIGGALPLMLRCLLRWLNLSCRSIGLIYGINLLGAGLGMLALPLLFLNRLSLPVTLVIVGSVNIALAIIIFLWSRRLPPDMGMPQSRSIAVDVVLVGAKLQPLIHVLAFVSGFFALGFAVSLFRALSIANPSSAYNAPLVVALFLYALASGSILFTRGAEESRDSILYRAGWLTTGSALGMFIGIWIASYLHGNWYPISFIPILEGQGYTNLPWVLLFCGVLIMPVPLMNGAIFPLLLKLLVTHEASLPDAAGKLYLIHLLGGFCGAVLGSLAGFSLLGTQGFLTLIYAVACVAGIAVMVWVWRRNLERRGGGFSGALPAGMLVLCVVVAGALPSNIWLTYITGGPESNWEVHEGVSGVAQLWWEEEHADVRVNGQYVSRLPYHERHVKQEIFLLAQPRREKVLVLGIGGANIIRSLVEDAQIASIDLVDLSYELPDLLVTGRAAEMLNHAFNSPKLRIIKADPRVTVDLYEPAAFDLVFDNLAYPSWAGASSIKSATYYAGIKRILKPEGVFVVSANYSSVDSRLAMLAGLVQAFDIVKEHANGEVVIATSREPEYSNEWIIEVALPRAGIFGLNFSAPDALAAWFHNEQRFITAEQLMGASPIQDDFPIYEYFWHPL
jgi:spermidine synthase